MSYPLLPIELPLYMSNVKRLTHVELESIFEIRNAITSRHMVHMDRSIYEIDTLGHDDLTALAISIQAAQTAF